MKAELAEWLADAANSYGDGEAVLVPSYSGRGMWGEETHAVSVSSALNLLQAVIDKIVDDPDSAADLEGIPTGLRQDADGYKTVLY